MAEKKDIYSNHFWDTIEVGASNLNHSEKFFCKLDSDHQTIVVQCLRNLCLIKKNRL